MVSFTQLQTAVLEVIRILLTTDRITEPEFLQQVFTYLVLGGKRRARSYLRQASGQPG